MPAAPRAIPLGDSASRDAPVLEYAYGPRAQFEVGGELGILRWQRGSLTFHLSAFALIALENGTSQLPVPTELFRLFYGATAAWSFPAPSFLPGGDGLIELSLGLAREQASSLGNYQLPEPTPTNGIPFGGGGELIDPAIAWTALLGSFEVTARLDERIHLPQLVRIFGQTPADIVADYTNDALTNQPAAELVVRMQTGWRVQPIFSGHADLQFPRDVIARRGFFLRGMLGLAIQAGPRELMPFLSGDIGNGLGLLVNRREARLSIGARYVGF